MLKTLLPLALLALPLGAIAPALPALAETATPTVAAPAAQPPALPQAAQAIQDQILPGFSALADSAARLADAAATDCSPTSAPLVQAWGRAFDDWTRVSHLRFGPTETENRAFALAYWPDTRGTTPKILNKLFADKDPIITTPEGVASVSIAARGFYALEFLLFDPKYQADAGYACALTRALTADVAATAATIERDWRESYAALMLSPGSEYSPYHSAEEVNQELFKALSTGLQFTSDTRLGRPLGTFDKPRPTRAEAVRSGRSLHQVQLSLGALKQLAVILTRGNPALETEVTASFDTALAQAAALDDPVFAGVEDPSKRLKIEILQQTIDLIRQQELANIGDTLGVAAGFNALDGD